DISVGYLVGAGVKSFIYLVYESERNIEKHLKAKYGGRLISWYIPMVWYNSDYEDDGEDVEVRFMYWSDTLYLKYYDLAKSGDFEKLCEDYYGLIEINIASPLRRYRIHFVAPKIKMIKEFIKKFDYITCRWRVYGWKKTRSPRFTYREIAEAIWYSTKISPTAQEVIYQPNILERLIKDSKLIKKVREIMF
ncbi:MAG: hypothetical protein Q6363_004105, partial [Candidatus Njordarchaeota archaeon]